MDSSATWTWRHLGNVSVKPSGDMKMPTADERPAIYRYTLSVGDDRRTYIGETANLHRRFSAYRNSRSSNTNRRMNDRIRRVVDAGGVIVVETMTDIEGDPDLSDKRTRLALEAEALKQEIVDHGETINGAGTGRHRKHPVLG